MFSEVISFEFVRESNKNIKKITNREWFLT